jgi:hypothetical protein
MSWAAAAVALLALAGAGRAQTDAAGPRLDLRIEPAVDLWNHGRALADSRGEVPGPMAELVAAIRAVGAKLPRGAGWGRFDSGVIGITGAEELAARFAKVGNLQLRGGGEIDLSIEMAAVAAILRATEPAFLAEIWPARQAAIVAGHEHLEEHLLPKQAEAFAAMLAGLEMTDPGGVIPVYLVATAPWPGATTYRGRDGGFCVVAVDQSEYGEGALREIVLHEATHALDLAAGESVLSRLRDRLREAGLGPADDAFRDLPHTIMFAQAGETVRRVIDPRHVHYGDGPSTYYDRVTHGRLVRDLWVEHLDGKLSTDQVIERLVAAATG